MKKEKKRKKKRKRKPYILWEIDVKVTTKKKVFLSDVEWAPFKCLFWNVNDSIVKLMVSITSGYFLCHIDLVINLC